MGAKNAKVFTFREQIQGFPWMQVVVVAVIRFAEPIAFTSLFPYIYFMVKSFHADQPEHEVALYAGYISGTFALCQSFTGILWGRLSDKYGRKPIIIMGLIFSAICQFMFGTSKSFSMALLARALGGLSNGNVGVIRTVLGEIAVNRHHQPLAFTVMPLLWQVGCVLGPMVGGYLATPIISHPTWFEKEHFLHKYTKLFSEYPFLLPNLVVTAGLIFGAIFTFFFLEETHMLKKKQKVSIKTSTPAQATAASLYLATDLPSHRSDTHMLARENDSSVSLATVQPASSSSASLATRAAQGPQKDSRPVPETISVDIENQQAQQEIQERYDALANDPHLHDWSRVLVPRVRRLLLATGANSLQATVYEELLPVYLCSSVLYSPGSTLKGGLGLSSENMGTVLSSCGIVGIISMLFYFPWLERNYGCIKPLKIASKVVPFFPLICPFYLYAVDFSTTQKLIFITFFASLRVLCQGICYPSILLLFNQAAEHPLHMGTINGCCQMVSALARAIGPIVWGMLMDYGQQKGHVEIPWWSLAVFSILSALQISRIHGEDYDERE